MHWDVLTPKTFLDSSPLPLPLSLFLSLSAVQDAGGAGQLDLGTAEAAFWLPSALWGVQ